MNKLDYKKMVEDIDSLIKTDFLSDIEGKIVTDGSPLSQEQSEEMINVLLKIYEISHCTTCTACQTKYVLTDI